VRLAQKELPCSNEPPVDCLCLGVRWRVERASGPVPRGNLPLRPIKRAPLVSGCVPALVWPTGAKRSPPTNEQPRSSVPWRKATRERQKSAARLLTEPLGPHLATQMRNHSHFSLPLQPVCSGAVFIIYLAHAMQSRARPISAPP